MNSVAISGRLVAIGNREFIENVVIPIAQAIEPLSQKYPPPPDEDDAFFEEKAQFYGMPGALEALVGIVAFVGTWAAKTALDEIYGDDLRQVIRNMRDRITSQAQKNHVCAISLLVRKVPERITLMVIAAGETVIEVERSEKMIPRVVTQAMEYAERNAIEGEIHIYYIDNGEVGAEPMVVSDWRSAVRALRGISPIGSPKINGSGS